MGWPVGHSLSPRLHGYWLDRYGIDGSYVPLAVKPEDVAAVLRDLPQRGFAGVNVTVPHKETALGVMDSLSAEARRIGAVNTVVIDAEGRLEGRNTDGYGFLENLKAGAPDWNPASAPVVVLGAGGAARAVVAALLDAGVSELRLFNFWQLPAEALADDLADGHGGTIQVCPWDDRAAALDGAGLVVNCTVLGMTGKPPLELDLSRLPPGAMVYDIVYAPRITPLLKTATARGNRTVEGIGMLLHQARAGFAAWFGVDPEVTDELRDHVLAGVGR